jgi:hemoglobin/transferrin/lactoferrin receptor protein
MSRIAWLFWLWGLASLARAEATLPTVPVEPLRPDQEASPTEATTELPPLVVVGTRNPREISDITGSVSVVTAREIEFQGASNLGEVFRDLPGVALEGGPRANAEFVNVRGLSGPRVLLIVDGARQNFLGGHRSSLLVDPEMLKQVELLRGPASALWGSDAVGGVVVLSTKDAQDFLRPGERLAGRLRVSAESNNGEQLGSGILAGRLGDLDAVFSLSERSAGDYRDGAGERIAHTALDASARLAKLSWLPAGSPHALGLIRQAFVQDSVSPSNPATEVTDTNPLIDRTNDTTYWIGRYAFLDEGGEGWLRAANINAYRDELRIREDRVGEPRNDRTFFQTDGASAALTVPAALGVAGAAAAETLFTFGLDGFRDQSRATRDGAPRPQFPDAERALIGGFVQAEIPVGALAVVPGLRHDRYRARSRQDDSAEVRESATSGKLGLVYTLREGVKLRASVNEAFRAPGLSEIYAAGQHFLGNDFVPNPNLRPEKARNWELGFSLDLPGWAEGHEALLSGSVYRNRVRDFIELFVEVESEFPAVRCLSPTPPVGCVNRNDDGTLNPASVPVFVGGITSSRNLDSATLEGVELEAAYALGPLRLGASFSQVQGRDDASGQPLFNIAADRVRTTLAFEPHGGGLRGTLGHTRVFAQNEVPRFVDDNGEEQDSVPKTPAYSRWDLSLSYAPFGEGRAFGVVAPRLSLGVDNLGNERYRDHLNVLQSPGRNVRGGLSFGF